MSHAVFISYASKDKRVTDAVVKVLEDNGVRCWIAPRDVLPGMEYAAAIIDALNTCPVFLVILSEISNSSPQVSREVERAISKNRVVLTFRIDNTPLSKAMEYYLSDRHWIDASEGNYTHQLANLVKAVKLLLPTQTPEVSEAQTSVGVPHIKPVEPEVVPSKDVVRQPAKPVQPGRHRWYSQPLLWGIVGILAFAGLVIWLAPKLGMLLATTVPTGTAPSTQAMGTQSSANALTPTTLATWTAPPTLGPAPTPVPLAWSQLSAGQFIQRDQLTALVIDPNDPSVLYVGTEDAGVYKSIDGGASWQPAQNGLGRASINMLLIDPKNPHTLYASVKRAVGTTSVYKTTDAGASWQPLDVVGDIFDSVIAMDPADPQHLLFSEGNSIFESVDGGSTWNQINEKDACPTNIANIAFSPRNPKKIFVVGECNGASGVVNSDDGGQSWTMLGLKNVSMNPQFLAEISPEGDELLYANADGELRVSADGGTTWLKTGLQDCYSMAADPGGSVFAACGSVGLVKISERGAHWDVLTKDQSVLGTVLAFSPQSYTEFFSGKTTLFVTRDGSQSWTELINGLGADRSELVLDPASSAMYLDGQALYRSTDGGHNWEAIPDAGNSMIAGHLTVDAEGMALYAVGEASLLLSKDKGTTWEKLGYPPGVQNAWAITLNAHSTRRGVLFLDYNGENLYVSSDGGSSWEERAPLNGYWNAVFHFGQGQIIYGANDVKIIYSLDEGGTWQGCGNDNYPATTRYSLAIDPGNSDRIYIALSGKGISRSMDRCKSWSPQNDGLGNLFVNAIAIDPKNPDIIYAGTDGGAYVSFDYGEHWGQINDGFASTTIVYSIVVDAQSNVYASTPFGVFQLVKK